MAETVEVATGMVAIDTMMAARAQLTSAYLLHADEPALIETGPSNSLANVIEGLAQLGIGRDDLAHIVVTHIHLDHAGGVGRLSARFPKATVWVHDRGAPHLAHPAKLVASATRVYGEQRLHELFGPVDPVDPKRLRPVTEGDRIRLGDRTLDVMYTPGHASHHISLVDSETGALFTGDALGIHLPDVRVLRPATPPPDVDVELAVDSIERIRRRAGPVLMFSHFGPVDEVDELCTVAARRWKRWAGIVREAMDETDDVDRIGDILATQVSDEFEPVAGQGADTGRYEVFGSMRINAMGLVRYWNKRAEREQSAPTPASPGAPPHRTPEDRGGRSS